MGLNAQCPAEVQQGSHRAAQRSTNIENAKGMKRISAPIDPTVAPTLQEGTWHPSSMVDRNNAEVNVSWFCFDAGHQVSPTTLSLASNETVCRVSF